MVSKSWCYTLNNPTPEEIDTYRTIDCTRHVAGLEIAPTTGTPHLQGFITLRTAHRPKKVMDILPRAHIEICRSVEASARYCAKDFKVVIEINNANPGKRNDLHEVTTKIKEGAKVSDVALEHSTTFVKYAKGIRELSSIVAQKATNHFRTVTTTVLVGPTGSGKTSGVYTQHGYENVYIIDMSQSTLWFDGYEGQDVLLIDEFRGQMSFSFFLRLLDGYPVRLPVKGCFTYANWTKVYITSNRAPQLWFPKLTPEDSNALSRRIGEDLIKSAAAQV